MKRSSTALLALSLSLSAGLAGAQAAPSAAPTPPQAAALPPNAWRIDKSHSELSFQIRHLVSRVRGTFRDWEGTITVDDPAKWEQAAINVKIRTASIFTDNDRRDTHLRTSDFFLADSFPEITFRSIRIERDGDKARIHGMLTMRGVTRAVVLDGQFLGRQQAGNGIERVGFEASTTINRLDYGVAWNRAVEGGGATLGDDVKIELAIAATRRTAPATGQ